MVLHSNLLCVTTTDDNPGCWVYETDNKKLVSYIVKLPDMFSKVTKISIMSDVICTLD